MPLAANIVLLLEFVTAFLLVTAVAGLGANRLRRSERSARCPAAVMAIIISSFIAQAAHARPAMTPACPAPAQYISHQSCAISVSVVYYVKVVGDPVQVPNALAQQYGFDVIENFTSFNLFRASLTPEQVAQIRCDARVEFIEEPAGDLCAELVPLFNPLRTSRSSPFSPPSAYSFSGAETLVIVREPMAG